MPLRARGGIEASAQSHARDGYSAIYPQKSLSKPGAQVYRAPYLLRDLKASHFGHVWSVDISYIAMGRGFMYMIGVIDVYSRMLVGRALSNTLDTTSSVGALEDAIARWGAPEIVNTDQGCQYTSRQKRDTLTSLGIGASMDGPGRCKDNIWIERFWRTLKRECVYLNPMARVCEMRQEIKKFIEYYNYQRPHQGIRYKIPYECCPKEKLIINRPVVA